MDLTAYLNLRFPQRDHNEKGINYNADRPGSQAFVRTHEREFSAVKIHFCVPELDLINVTAHSNY